VDGVGDGVALTDEAEGGWVAGVAVCPGLQAASSATITTVGTIARLTRPA
jgi:hypothetical protein